MTVRSNRKAVSAEIERVLAKKNEACAIVVEGNAKRVTPVGTPESTGIENYRGGRLRDSVTHDSDETGFVVGTNLYYGPFVHNGTYDFKQEQFEALDSVEATAAAVAEAKSATGEKGMKPRPYLAEGILNSVQEMKRIYDA